LAFATGAGHALVCDDDETGALSSDKTGAIDATLNRR
jgi:hypothetical protein